MIKPKLNYRGLPVSAVEWTAADWQDLHVAIERAIRTIAARHRERAENDTVAGRRRNVQKSMPGSGQNDG